MMAPTHVLAGMLLGLTVAPLSPGGATAVVLAGAAGGVAPDLDALWTHRRTLHFPVYATALGGGVLGLAVLGAPAWTALVGTFLGAAGLHALGDVLDGGRSLRPWAATVDRAVYCHAQGRWWRPRRLLAYDGSPADLALAAGLAVPVLGLAEAAALRWLVGGLLAVSVAYALVRRRLPDLVDGATARQGTGRHLR